jgi:predicted DNA-binding protein with PD1-like motif
MKSRLVHEEHGQRTFVLVFDTGDEAVRDLTEFARREHLTASHFTGIGALERLVIAYFDWGRRDYVDIPISEQVEVLSLAGDIALKDGQPVVHAHVVVGKQDGTAHGGHLVEAHVRPTLEVILVESPAYLRRTWDDRARLALIDLSD